MMGERWTKGPWTTGNDPYGSGKISVHTGDEFVCIVDDGIIDVVKANANLIAAAPELYEALQLMQKNWHHMAGFSSPAEVHRINEIAEKALAKARGESK